MKTFQLTLNPDEFREIYHIAESQKELKSIKIYWSLIIGVLATAAGVYRMINISENRDEVLTLLITFGLAVYMFDKFLRNRKAITSRIKSIEDFISKNQTYKSTKVCIDEHYFILEQDEEYSKVNMNESTEIKIVETHASLHFKTNNYIVPKRAFAAGEWDEFIERVKRYA